MRRMIVAGAVALAFVAGCSSMGAKREGQRDMVAVLQRMAGNYVGAAATPVGSGAAAAAAVAGEAASAGNAAAASRQLRIIPVDDNVIGDYVFYVRLLSTGSSRRILSQQIWSFSQAKDGSVVQAVYRFTDPGRWRQAANYPQLLQALTEPDLKQLKGCELTWRRQGTDYAGTVDPSCRPGGSEGAALLAGANLLLNDNGITFMPRPSAAPGAGADTGEAAAIRHFRRLPQSGGADGG